MSWRRAGAGLLALLLAAAAFVVVQAQRRPAVAPYRAPELPAAAPAHGALRLRFAGVSTLVFDDGETAFATDGFFSRPGKWATLAGRIGPDHAAVERELKALGVTRLAAVIPLHSHYDHAMDAPLVARLTGARLLGSPSTLQVGRGAGLAEAQMREVKPGDALVLGRFTLRFIPSRHSPTPWTDGDKVEAIDAPLEPPAHASAWRTGTVWSLLVEHGGRRLLVQASAGFVPGALAGQRADVVLLGTGTLGKKAAAYRADYWRETVAATGAKRVIPIHWDDFWRPLDDAPLVAMPYLLDDFGATMDDLQARAGAANVDLRMPPLRTPFDPFEGVP